MPSRSGPLERHRTNLCTNPSAVTNTTGWAASGTTTFERVTSLPTLVGVPGGITTGFHAVGDGNQDRAGFSLAVTSGLPYVHSVSVYVVSIGGGTPIVRCRIRDASAVIKAQGSFIAEASTDFVRLATNPTVADATATWTFTVEQSGAGATEFYWTADQIELGSSASGHFFATTNKVSI